MTLNINDFKKELVNSKVHHQETFKYILSICMCKMKTALKMNMMELWFEVPQFVLGKPTFSLDECMKFLGNELTANGFHVMYFFPRVLHISWYSAITTTPATTANVVHTKPPLPTKNNPKRKLLQVSTNNKKHQSSPPPTTKKTNGKLELILEV